MTLPHPQAYFARVSIVPNRPARGTVSLPRALSKIGVCSRAEGARLVESGRVKVNGRLARDVAMRISPERDDIEVDGAPVMRAERIYLALNKPRGLVTTRDDPRGRPTVYRCLEGATLPFVAPVGRLDKASEGLLLLTNDSRWSSKLLDPASHVEKVYHVQVKGLIDAEVVARIAAGVTEVSSGERLDVVRAALLRVGSRSTAWVEIVLDEGRNRHIRRLLSELGIEVLRLIRISIGPLTLGTLPKGEWRMLTADEVRSLA
ncbi:pseudouridine synthase [soil metagenome]